MFRTTFCIIVCLCGFSLVSATLFQVGQDKGRIKNKEIDEASGLAASISRENKLWTHNDSGDKARLFLIDEKASSVAEYTLKDATNRDWEDIATGPGPLSGEPYVYVGDIGDNRALYDEKFIYRFIEPNEKSATEITDIDVIKFVYPDGKRDAESLFVDPLTKDIYVLSKREDKIGVYVAHYPQSLTETITLKKLTTIAFHNTVAADITTDGQEILLKTYSKVYYWKREGRSIRDTLNSEPLSIDYKVEPQGEAIAWKKDASGFFTLSEKRAGVVPVLYYYARQ